MGSIYARIAWENDIWISTAEGSGFGTARDGGGVPSRVARWSARDAREKYRQPEKATDLLWFNEPEISVLALIQDANPIGICIAKHEKLIGFGRQLQRGFFGGHRLD